jgi:hypothetical protein
MDGNKEETAKARKGPQRKDLKKPSRFFAVNLFVNPA